jgi:hypothetical protein
LAEKLRSHLRMDEKEEIAYLMSGVALALALNHDP